MPSYYLRPPTGWPMRWSGYGGSGLDAPWSPNVGGNSPPVGGNSPPVGGNSPNVGGHDAPWSPNVGGHQAMLSPPVGGRHSPPHSLPWGPAAVDPARGSRLSQAIWQGQDADWTYANGSTLLAQALRKTRTRLAPSVEPDQPPAAPGAVSPYKAPPLWRWERMHRVQALVAELQARCVVQGLQLWWVAPPGAGAAAPCSPILTLPDVQGQDFSAQIDKVLRAAIEREERLPEILSQAEDFGPFFDALIGVNRATLPRLSEVLEVSWLVATGVVMALKNEVHAARPWQRSSRVVPVIPTPGHGSLPSGHATIAAMTAGLYIALLRPMRPAHRLLLDRLARRIAHNREVAGVHFPIDSAAGYALGCQLAQVLQAAGEGQALPGALDLQLDPKTARLADRVGKWPDPELSKQRAPAAAVPALASGAPNWQQMWRAARKEWTDRSPWA